MITLDTEDDSAGTVTIIDFFNGQNHETFVGDNCRFKAWGYLRSVEPETCFAVNAEYDLINLFGPWLGKLTTLQYVKAGFMRASFRESKITFLDTMRHWPCSVESMGKAVGLPKLSMPHLGCTCDDCVTYCRRDAEITWRYVSAMIERYESLGLDTLRSTLPSMAFSLFRQFYPNEFPEIDDYRKRELRRGYYGGRVEIYKLGEINGSINHYDVNSLFPSVMRDYSFPRIDSMYVTENPNLEAEGIWEGWIHYPKQNIPSLPVRCDEIIFPYGNLYGSWCYPEIRQAVADGAKLVKCKQAIEFDDVENPFDGYVNFCYGKRLEADNEIDKSFWKLMLNSLYGKFGAHNEITVIYNDEEKTLSGESKQANVIWAAYTTCYARLRLLEFLRSCSISYYTDTDSLFTPDELPVSADLGELKLEGCYEKTWFKGNKIYYVKGEKFTGDGPIRVDQATTKGVPRKLARDFFQNGKATYRKPNRFRESRKRNLIPNVWSEITKENKKEYTKRKILADGNTEPWNISEYRQYLKNHPDK